MDPNLDDSDDFLSGAGVGTTPSYSDDLLTPSAPSSQFLDSSDDEDERRSDVNQNGAVSLESTSKRLDYMLQFLDRKLSMKNNDNNYSTSCSTNYVTSILDSNYDQNDVADQQQNAPLPEFVARGGGAGIFRLPLRAAVHPNRPPSLDVRPHPLRETQIGRFLRIIVASRSQLWAGAECGLRIWDLNRLYGASTTKGHGDTLPFRESVKTAPALCLVADEGTSVVWSGHRDGRIRCWRMDQEIGIGVESGCGTETLFKEGLSWQAHRGPVLSLVISSYGKYCSCFFSLMQFVSLCFLFSLLLRYFGSVV